MYLPTTWIVSSSIGFLMRWTSSSHARHARFGLRQPEQLQDDVVQPLVAEYQRNLIDRRHILGGDDGVLVDVTEQRDLLLDVPRKDAVGAAEQDVGLDTDRSQVAHAVLGRLGLQFASRSDEGHQREVDVDGVLAPDVLSKLADRLQKRQALDVADRAADLDQHDIGVSSRQADAVLDFVRDVRDDLDGPAEIVAAALFLNHRHVDLAGRPVAVAGRRHAGEPLVVPEIQVGLGPIVGHVDLAVLIRAHRARIHVDVRVELLKGHAIAVALEQGADRRGGEALAERRHHAAGHEDVFGLSSGR